MAILPRLLGFVIVAVATVYAVGVYNYDASPVNSPVAIPIALALGTGLGLLTEWMYRRRLVREPLQKLIACANALREGSYPPREALTAGKGEFGRLAQAFDEMAEQLAAREAQLRESEQRFRRLSDASFEGVAIHDGERIIETNAAAARIFGYEPGEVDGMPLTAFLAPEARDRSLAIARADVEARYESVGLRKDGSKFPVEFRGRRIEHKGRPARIIAIRDLTEQKNAAAALSETAERLKLLAAEVDHRSKNMLALVQIMLRHTRADTVREFADAVQGRVAALARAHTLLSESRWESADLGRLIEEELAPFRRTDAARVRFNGPPVALSSRAAQSFAMALHELATNAAKHGALSVPEGSVSVEWTWQADDRLVLRWSETGGPPVAPPTRRGLGTTVIERSIAEQLHGAARFDWRTQGLACELDVPAAKVTNAAR